MAWVKDWPVSEGTGTSAVSGSTEQIRANWVAMEEIIDAEHESMASANDGDHRPGRSGFVYYGAFSGVSALTSPGTGALAYTTDTGEFLIYLPTAEWGRITKDYWSRIRKAGAGQSLPNDTWTKLTISTAASGNYDSLSEVSSDKFTAKAGGYYLIVGVIRFPVTSSNYQKGICIYKNGAAITESRRYGAAERTISVIDIFYLAATNYIEIYGAQNSGGAVTTIGAALSIQRLS